MADSFADGPGIRPRPLTRYNKFYIGLAADGVPNNFVIFKPKKGFITIQPRLEQSEEIQGILDASGIDGWSTAVEGRTLQDSLGKGRPAKT
jgi:hypothetical protein